MLQDLSLRIRCDRWHALSFQQARFRWGRRSGSLPADPRPRTFHVSPEWRQTSRRTISSFRRPWPCRSGCDERRPVAQGSDLRLGPLALRVDPTAWLAADSWSPPGWAVAQTLPSSPEDAVRFVHTLCVWY